MNKEQVVSFLEGHQAEQKSLWYLVYDYLDKTFMAQLSAVPAGACVRGKLRFAVWEATAAADGTRAALVQVAEMVIPDLKDPSRRLVAGRFEAEMEAGMQGWREATAGVLEAVLDDMEEPAATQVHLQPEEEAPRLHDVWDEVTASRELHHLED